MSTETKSNCSAETWPLTYDDGTNLRSKSCENGYSYYICKFQGRRETHKKIKKKYFLTSLIIINGQTFRKVYAQRFDRIRLVVIRLHQKE